MILVFTSDAFKEWVEDNVQAAEGTAFNPYLAFLFIAL